MASEHFIPMLEIVHEILAKGDETIEMLMLNATTPTELASARLAEAAITSHAHVIRKLLDMQAVLDEGIEKIVQQVNHLS